MSEKPNIIFIHNDHQAYYRWGWDAGIKPLRPNFGRLAAAGAVFENAYCTTPLCGPVRRTLLTGLYTHAHRQYHNYTDPPYDSEVYLDTLTAAGYDCHYFGKWHAGPGAAREHGCGGFSYTDYNNPYNKPEYFDYLERHNLPRALHRISHVFDVDEYSEKGFFPGLKPGADYRCETSWCGEHAVGVTTTPKETHESFFLANLACEQLEKLAAGGEQKPFALRVDFWGPHQPHFPTQEFLDLYPDFSIPPYGSFGSALTGKPDFYHRERSMPFGADNRLQIPNPMPWDEWQVIIRHAFAHISMIDAAGGRILDKVRELGLDKNTLIIWTTDHGDALASHGGHFDKASYSSEEVMRIPLAMSWPGVIPPGQVRKELVGSIDFPVTMLAAAGLRFSRNPVHGESLLPLVRGAGTAGSAGSAGDAATADAAGTAGAAGRPVAWRDSLMCEHYGHGFGETLVSRMLRHGDWKYVATRDHLSELYNLAEDPYELHNRIEDPACAGVLADLQKRLHAIQEQTDDPEIGIV